jgi:hypothetical protein
VRRLYLLAALTITTVAAAVAPPSASSPPPPILILEECRGRAVFVPGAEELVRRRVPAQFELVRDPLGRPLLLVDGSRCERITVDGKTRPTTFALFMAIIESPDGAGCLSQWPLVGGVKSDLVPLCNFYSLFIAFDNRAVVKGIRSLVPDFPIRYVPGHVFEAEDFDLTRLGAPFRFRAGRRTPSPFELNGVVREVPAQGPATYSFWFTGSSGTVMFREDIDELAIGQMDARLRAASGSEMAELLGTETPTPIAGLATRSNHHEIRFLPPE